MKDIYELLNEANIDVEEIEEMEVSEVERKRGKKRLRSSLKSTLKGGQSQKGISRKIAIAALLGIFMGLSSIFIAKPTWASNIPIIGDLIQNTLIDVNSKYMDYIQVVGQTKSDQGIDITFESAIVDRNELNLIFIIKNNNGSIEENSIDSLFNPTFFKINGEIMLAIGGSYEIIDENTVRVLRDIGWEQYKLGDYLNVDIEISEMFGKIGNWDISFALDTKEIEKNTYVKKLDKVINVESIDYNLNDIIITPLTTSINYDYIFTRTSEEVENRISKDLDFIMFDEKGNEVRWNGGNTSQKGNKFTGRWKYINNGNIEKLDIIPLYSEKSEKEEEKLPPIKINIEEFSPISIKINEDTLMSVYNCIIDGEYIIFEYYYIYLDKVVSNTKFSDLYINVDGKSDSRYERYETNDEMDKLYRKYDTNNNSKMVKISKICDSKDIEIGAYDGTSIEILKDQAFTVTKNN